MAARIDNGRVQLPHANWTGLDPQISERRVRVGAPLNAADGLSLTGNSAALTSAGLPGFAQTQAATDGERGVHVRLLRFRYLAP